MRAHEQCLALLVGGQRFALVVEALYEIRDYEGVLVLPQMPEFVRGVIERYGAVVPVIDLAARLGNGATEVTGRTRIVVVDMPLSDGVRTMGVMIDSIGGFIYLSPQSPEWVAAIERATLPRESGRRACPSRGHPASGKGCRVPRASDPLQESGRHR